MSDVPAPRSAGDWAQEPPHLHPPSWVLTVQHCTVHCTLYCTAPGSALYHGTRRLVFSIYHAAFRDILWGQDF